MSELLGEIDTATALGVFHRVWSDARTAVANGVPLHPPRMPGYQGRAWHENPLTAPEPAKALLKDHVARLLARREELGLSHDDVAAIMWGLRRLDWVSMRSQAKVERKGRGASNEHVAEVQFPSDFGGGRVVEKWENGQRIPNGMDLVDWCTSLGLHIEITPMEEGLDGEAAE